MASRDRKRQIFDHLAKSIEGTGYVKPVKETTPVPESIVPPPSEPAPASQLKDRKRQIMNHVQQSSSNFGDFSLTDKNKQQRIQDHIKKSLG
jgi:hypothetical protein